MLKNKKFSLIISIILVLAVIAVLVFITINKKHEVSSEEKNINMENTQDINGVKVTILKEGTGDEAKIGDTVSVGYIGVLADGKVFDSNIDPKTGQINPFSFQIGNKGPGGVIEGWNIGVAGMKVGEQRKLEIPSQLAYGEQGAGDVIPPNATLTFMVELVAINK